MKTLQNEFTEWEEAKAQVRSMPPGDAKMTAYQLLDKAHNKLIRADLIHDHFVVYVLLDEVSDLIKSALDLTKNK